MQIEKAFLKEIIIALFKNPHFNRIYKHFQKQMKNIENSKSDSQIVYQFYRLNINSKLLYMLNHLSFDRIYIPEKLTYKVLKYEYNRHVYEGIHRTYNRLQNAIYFSKMRKAIQSYIDNYSIC